MSEATTIAHDVPEGWYTDPENTRMQRYWDGSDWSDHVRYADASAMPRASAVDEPTVYTTPEFEPVPDRQALLAYLANPNGVSAKPTFEQSPAIATQAAFVPTLVAEPTTKTDPFVFPSVAAEPAFTVAPGISAHREINARPSFDLNAERIAYVPMREYYLPPTARPASFNPRAFSPSTAAIWIMALSPAVWTGSQVLNTLLTPVAAAPAVSLLISGAMFVVLLVSMLADRAVLRKRNMATPGAGWFFLGMVPYFTVRWMKLRKEGTRYVSPAVTFIALLIASAVAWVNLLGPSALIR